MDERTFEQRLSEALVEGWDITPTGNGFLLATDWLWPNSDRIEIYVRFVGEREDLYLVTDGGDLFNFLFSVGIDLTKDDQGLRMIKGAVERYGAKFVDYQIVKGANEGDLAQAVRMILESVKDASLLLWHKLDHSAHFH